MNVPLSLKKDTHIFFKQRFKITSIIILNTRVPDFCWHDRLPQHRQELRDQRPQVQEGVQRGTHCRRDQGLAVHHPHEEDLPH